MNVFKWIEHIIKKKTPYTSFTSDEWNKYDIFMVNKILSMNPAYLNIVEYIQGFSNLTKEKHYRMYCETIPQNNRTYSPYIKSKTQKLDKQKLKYISDLFEISPQEANEYVEIMGKEWFRDILDQYGLEKKEKTKILKLK